MILLLVKACSCKIFVPCQTCKSTNLLANADRGFLVCPPFFCLQRARFAFVPVAIASLPRHYPQIYSSTKSIQYLVSFSTSLIRIDWINHRYFGGAKPLLIILLKNFTRANYFALIIALLILNSWESLVSSWKISSSKRCNMKLLLTHECKLSCFLSLTFCAFSPQPLKSRENNIILRYEHKFCR